MENSPVITYNGIQKTDALEHLIQSRISRLESVCDRISHCHIAVEWTHIHAQGSGPYRVMIDLVVPPDHEVAVTNNPDGSDSYAPLETVIREAFDSTQTQLTRLLERQQQQPQGEFQGAISKLFPVGKCGFIQNAEGDEIYFHRDCVVDDAYDRLTVGTLVQYSVFWTAEGVHAKISQFQ